MAIKLKEVDVEIKELISADPTIKDPHKIFVSLRKEGLPLLGKKVISLEGSVDSEQDSKKVERIARHHCRRHKVVNKLYVRQTRGVS